jgi:intracellular septation protein
MSLMKSSPPKISPSLKASLEYGPLLLFFLVNLKFGIYYGTGVLVAATVISIGLFWFYERQIPKMLAFGCGAVVFFGALTLIFKDDTFIKLKPTVVSLSIAAVLWGGQLMGYNLLKSILGGSMKIDLPDAGWRGLTRLWVLMFTVIAISNELAWRNLSTDNWVTFKVFGLTGLSLVFGVMIAIYLSRYSKSE